ncbi:saccharopine dehydrogenase C-terminal domain-containing protein [Sediminibacterium soli]|uniref:saccharopine dehydrogenase C-terminal domain-containing protein n=1 Tax=Sediminibacterium soli TaxID=2698829 RepID=UPI00137A7856|nr:saccharopine dehydrogenase C-terminal domain-containing protein [Sediminibacterium soli]NCI46295.1 saccharopine dehydrogenase [Sediminibacterium soli]
MEPVRHIVLLGAGKSATVLIEFLKDIATRRKWKVTVADKDISVIEKKIGQHSHIRPLALAIDKELQRHALIESADLVISLLPPALHFLVAQDCVLFRKHLLTASYVDNDMAGLAKEINKLDVLFLCEMGLDPGIDHMSAMQMVDRIRNAGGRIQSFVSHCGGLVAPESDDNPWHYKISWNPKSVVLAGKAGATFREQGATKTVKYEQLFKNCQTVTVQDVDTFTYYPNRDSLTYISAYGLQEVQTFIRTTLRHPDFCKAWQLAVDLGLTDEKNTIETDSMSIGAFIKAHFDRKKISTDIHDAVLKAQFDFIGLNDETLINKGQSCSADIWQWILEKKLALAPADKDMIVMLHELEYEIDGKKQSLKSELVVKGQDSLHTAMARTVGLPLGIAAVLVLDEKIKQTGLHTPTVPGIYEPVLAELVKHGIAFREIEP